METVADFYDLRGKHPKANKHIKTKPSWQGQQDRTFNTWMPFFFHSQLACEQAFEAPATNIRLGRFSSNLYSFS